MTNLTKKQQKAENELAANKATTLIVDGYNAAYIKKYIADNFNATKDFMHFMPDFMWEHYNNQMTELFKAI